MMLDPMPRLALQVWQLFLPAGKARAPTLRAPPTLSSVMLPAGSRLYIDVTGVLRIRRLRAALLGLLAHAYQALGQSIAFLVNRPEFHDGRAVAPAVLRAVLRVLGPVAARLPGALLSQDPAAAPAGVRPPVRTHPPPSPPP